MREGDSFRGERIPLSRSPQESRSGKWVVAIICSGVDCPPIGPNHRQHLFAVIRESNSQSHFLFQGMKKPPAFSAGRFRLLCSAQRTSAGVPAPASLFYRHFCRRVEVRNLYFGYPLRTFILAYSLFFVKDFLIPQKSFQTLLAASIHCYNRRRNCIIIAFYGDFYNNRNVCIICLANIKSGGDIF